MKVMLPTLQDNVLKFHLGMTDRVNLHGMVK